MYILYLELLGANLTLFTISLISSTLLFDAASSSIISGLLSKFIQELHLPHGSPSIGFSQLIALAKTRAVDVFPVPLGPEKI